MAEKKEEKVGEKKNELEILFPDEVVKINGVEVIMRPLPLEELPNVMIDFKEILDMLVNRSQSIGKSMGEIEGLSIGVSGIAQIVKVLPHCTFKKDKDGKVVPFEAKNLPAKAAYVLVKIFLKQNIPEELVGELTALIGVDPKILKKKND